VILRFVFNLLLLLLTLKKYEIKSLGLKEWAMLEKSRSCGVWPQEQRDLHKGVNLSFFPFCFSVFFPFKLLSLFDILVHLFFLLHHPRAMQYFCEHSCGQ